MLKKKTHPLADILRRSREEKIWSQKDLSKYSGVPVHIISRIELSNIMKIQDKTLQQLAKALKVDEYIFFLCAKQLHPDFKKALMKGGIPAISFLRKAKYLNSSQWGELNKFMESEKFKELK